MEGKFLPSKLFDDARKSHITASIYKSSNIVDEGGNLLEDIKNKRWCETSVESLGFFVLAFRLEGIISHGFIDEYIPLMLNQ